MDALNYPVLLGRLYNNNNRLFLRSFFDYVKHVKSDDYPILKQMDGFSSFEEIARNVNCSTTTVRKIYDIYSDKRSLTSLWDWNSLHWCTHCHTYVSDTICSICGKETQKLIFSPPCDPSLCSEIERTLINKKIRELGICMPDNALYIINSGVQDRVFFWEIAYGGKVIMRLNFRDAEYTSWHAKLLIDKAELQSLTLSCSSPEQIQKMILANKTKQNSLVNNALDYIEYMYGVFDSKPLLYFSAGKESMVLYSLLKQINKSANILTVTTGIDYPEDLEFMKYMHEVISADKKFTHYFFESDGNEAIEYLNKVGKLSITDPWCRLLIKKKQKNMGTEFIYHGNSFVAFEGTRWYETNFRRSNPMFSILKEYPNQVWASPIMEWTSFDVWIYLFAAKEPINPVYSKGFQRTTCWLCPAVNPFSIYLSKKYYPELWEKIQNCKLDAFADKDDRDIIY